MHRDRGNVEIVRQDPGEFVVSLLAVVDLPKGMNSGSMTVTSSDRKEKTPSMSLLFAASNMPSTIARFCSVNDVSADMAFLL
jgi:hypothetical protein